MGIVLTEDNYYSDAANYEYMSVSQFKAFAGTDGKVACEAAAMAELRGEWKKEKTTALLVGSYVDSYFEGVDSLERFQKNNPEIFSRDGELKAPYKQAERIIARIERDPFFMKCMSGQKQVIMTGVLFGTKWKIKMDSYIPNMVIVDLKVMESITKHHWVRDLGPVDFIRYWGYDIQGAIYQEIVRQNTGRKLPFYIAAATKEKETNIEVIHVSDNFLRDAMSIVEANMPRVLNVKAGMEEPRRCGTCDYCRSTKVLNGPIGILDLLKDV